MHFPEEHQVWKPFKQQACAWRSAQASGRDIWIPFLFCLLNKKHHTVVLGSRSFVSSFPSSWLSSHRLHWRGGWLEPVVPVQRHLREWKPETHAVLRLRLHGHRVPNLWQAQLPRWEWELLLGIAASGSRERWAGAGRALLYTKLCVLWRGKGSGGERRAGFQRRLFVGMTHC